MELKFPKKVQIGHHTFSVKYDKKESGGSFSYESREIIIGTQYLESDPSSVFGVIIHEVMEVIHCMTNTRYTDWGTMRDFKFFMTHKEFQTNIEIFTQVIQNFIK